MTYGENQGVGPGSTRLVVDKKSGDVPFGDALIAWRSCGVYDAGDNSMIEIEGYRS